MKVLLHGGFCCGIKTIAGMSMPEYAAAALAATPATEASTFTTTSMPASFDMHRETHGDTVFDEEAPQEKYPERLKRLVAFVKKHRKHGLIEVVISKNSQAKWIPYLEEQGFKMVTEFKNSNTSATLQVWHLVH
jgi:ribulose bisphosphate carboxylase small subunit